MFEKVEAENTLWVEKFRPQTIDDYVGNEAIISKVKMYLKSGDVPHLLLHGTPGTGKTTLAKIIANAIDCDVMYINASDENSVDGVRNKIKSYASSMGFSAGGKIIILDECDYLTPSAQAALRNLMETFSKSTRFILTCNYVEKVIDAIQSRCQVFAVHPPSKKEVAKRLVTILTEKGIEFKMEDLVSIVNSGYPDIRRVINTAQHHTIEGKLELDEQSIVEGNYITKLIEILKETKDVKTCFTKIRQLIADSKVKTFEPLYKTLYDEVDGYGAGHVGPLILIIAEHQVHDILVTDKEINVMAMLIKIIQEIHT